VAFLEVNLSVILASEPLVRAAYMSLRHLLSTVQLMVPHSALVSLLHLWLTIIMKELVMMYPGPYLNSAGQEFWKLWIA